MLRPDGWSEWPSERRLRLATYGLAVVIALVIVLYIVVVAHFAVKFW